MVSAWRSRTCSSRPIFSAPTTSVVMRRLRTPAPAITSASLSLAPQTPTGPGAPAPPRRRCVPCMMGTMMTRTPIHPGTVDWSGENPGMYLKEAPDGPFVTLVSFFRVVLSPHGRGHALVLLEAPLLDRSLPEALNVCVTDNQPLARWLVQDFVAHFGAFPGGTALEAGASPPPP